MLTPNQEGYLQTLPEDRIAHVVPFDPAVRTIAQEIISEVAKIFPIGKVFYLGSSKLGIAGENDIDLTVLGGSNFENSMRDLTQLYGNPTRENRKDKIVKWEFIRNGFPVELHLIDVVTPNFQEQIDTQEILENNKDLLLEYEQLKLKANGLPWREYLRVKYEFWNKILGL
jgi:hypothetical protein